jgi:pilus assembly protein Flp/PilA
LPGKGNDAMAPLSLRVRRFFGEDDGPTAVEYAVMLALIVVVCMGAIQSIGTAANSTFQTIATQLQTAAS